MYTGVIIISCAIFKHPHRKLFCCQLAILSIILHQCLKSHFFQKFQVYLVKRLGGGFQNVNMSIPFQFQIGGITENSRVNGFRVRSDLRNLGWLCLGHVPRHLSCAS